MTTDQKIETAIRRVIDHEEMSEESLVTFTVAEISPVMEHVARQTRLIEQLKNELIGIKRKADSSLELITALEKKLKV